MLVLNNLVSASCFAWELCATSIPHDNQTPLPHEEVHEEDDAEEKHGQATTDLGDDGEIVEVRAGDGYIWRSLETGNRATLSTDMTPMTSRGRWRRTIKMAKKVRCEHWHVMVSPLIMVVHPSWVQFVWFPKTRTQGGKSNYFPALTEPGAELTLTVPRVAARSPDLRTRARLAPERRAASIRASDALTHVRHLPKRHVYGIREINDAGSHLKCYDLVAQDGAVHRILEQRQRVNTMQMRLSAPRFLYLLHVVEPHQSCEGDGHVQLQSFFESLFGDVHRSWKAAHVTFAVDNLQETWQFEPNGCCWLTHSNKGQRHLQICCRWGNRNQRRPGLCLPGFCLPLKHRWYFPQTMWLKIRSWRRRVRPFYPSRYCWQNKDTFS